MDYSQLIHLAQILKNEEMRLRALNDESPRLGFNHTAEEVFQLRVEVALLTREQMITL